jgi:DnaJ-class molecular chaperone with C-terminal Zn finger domain
MSKVYLVISDFTDGETAFLFKHREDAVNYIKNTADGLGDLTTLFDEVSFGKYKISLRNNIFFTMRIEPYDAEKIKFHLIKFDHGKYVETRRFSTREYALKFVKKECKLDPGEIENESGKWHIVENENSLDISFVLTLVIFNSTPDSKYHTILGVKKSASKDEIKAAYRKKSKENHPDIGGSQEEFKKIHEAYNKLLSSEIKKDDDGFSKAYQCENSSFVLRKTFEQARQVNSGETRIYGVKQIFIGIAILILGIMISIASHNSAGPGEKYTIFTGLIFVGGWIVVKGFLNIFN